MADFDHSFLVPVIITLDDTIILDDLSYEDADKMVLLDDTEPLDATINLSSSGSEQGLDATINLSSSSSEQGGGESMKSVGSTSANLTRDSDSMEGSRSHTGSSGITSYLTVQFITTT